MPSDSHSCIWCRDPSKASVEHILPDALGCPPGFILTSGVCERCNNGLSHVDQALVHQFEIVAYIGGVRRKGNRPPAINSWAPLAAAYGANGPEMHINAGPQTIEALGKRIPAAKAVHGIHNVSIKRVGEFGTISFDQEFGNNSKFVRALYKVAIGSVAYFSGLDIVRVSIIDPVREFVKTGKGVFRAVMLEAHDKKQQHIFGPHFTMPGSHYPVVEMAIFGVRFFVDFDPNQQGLDHLRQTIPKEFRFTTLPVAPQAVS